MSSYEFTVVGDPTRARQTAADALGARQFVMHWSDEWTAKAVKGDKTKAVLLGAFAHYMEVGVAVRARRNEQCDPDRLAHDGLDGWPLGREQDEQAVRRTPRPTRGDVRCGRCPGDAPQPSGALSADARPARSTAGGRSPRRGEWRHERRRLPRSGSSRPRSNRRPSPTARCRGHVVARRCSDSPARRWWR